MGEIWYQGAVFELYGKARILKGDFQESLAGLIYVVWSTTSHDY